MRSCVYFCASCGSFKVQFIAWVNYNNARPVDSDPPLGVSYCERCEAECAVESADFSCGEWWIGQYQRSLGFKSIRDAVRSVRCATS